MPCRAAQNLDFSELVLGNGWQLRVHTSTPDILLILTNCWILNKVLENIRY